MFAVSSRPWSRLGLVLLALAVALLPACGKRRKTCYPVHGRVLVNGKPAKDLMVIFNPKNDAEPERLAPYAQTNEKGEFQLSTYVTNDGAPAGDYLVTFTWREASGLLKNQFEGPDRLKGKYNDPKAALHPVTIEKKPTGPLEFKLEVK